MNSLKSIFKTSRVRVLGAFVAFAVLVIFLTSFSPSKDKVAVHSPTALIEAPQEVFVSSRKAD